MKAKNMMPSKKIKKCKIKKKKHLLVFIFKKNAKINL